MRRLIDADLLSEAIHDNVPAPYEDASWAKENCLAEIEAAPTVDAVPVVRCRECKYRFKNNGHSKDGCPIIDANTWMDDDDFCSHGEREEGADNEP